MEVAYFRFYEELNDFLPAYRRKQPFAVTVPEGQTIKSLIESQGVPHTEVDLILVNGNPVSFRYKVHDGDMISVYPEFESFDISEQNLLRSKPLRDPRFILDVHLGKLARYLRMLGFDARYESHLGDGDLARIAKEEKRAILTRDRRLLMRREVERGYWIRSDSALLQLKEVLERFDLARSLTFASRCARCNGSLDETEEKVITSEYPGHKFLPGTRFYRCSICGHLYWTGTHMDHLQKTVRFAFDSER